MDWNLEIARSDPANRSSLISREAALRAEVAQTPLPASERELADMLLDNGTWLAANDNPVDAVERFEAVADKLVEQMQTAKLETADAAGPAMHACRRWSPSRASLAT